MDGSMSEGLPEREGKLRLLVFGSTGSIGSRVVREALSRGHAVTAVVRDESRQVDDGAHKRVADVTDAHAVGALARGHDVVVSAVGGMASGDPQLVVRAARSLLEALRLITGVRLMVVGGAGSLEIEPGLQLVDSPGFPKEWRAGSLAQRDALDVYRGEAEGVEWTYLSPADMIEPGIRTGRYATDLDRPVVDREGQSRISIEDYAVALVDELESPRHQGRRFTVGYTS